jgi:membrane protein DedA with SNARE-associated domain
MSCDGDAELIRRDEAQRRLDALDRAVVDARRQCKISKVTAMVYRDGLLIALLALFIPRRRTVTAMRIGASA